jgi:hypothetical protein
MTEQRRQQGEDEVEDLDVGAEESEGVKGGKPVKGEYKQKADGSLDAGLHFKYDLKVQKES